MGFYSSIILAANHGVKSLTDGVADRLLVECCLVEPDLKGDFGHALAQDLMSVFQSADVLSENDQFFCPTNVMFGRQIEIMHPEFEQAYGAAGWSFQFHGSGYFFPWTMADIQSRFTQHEKVLRFRELLWQRVGGRFEISKTDAAILTETWIDGREGWMWFGSQSM